MTGRAPLLLRDVEVDGCIVDVLVADRRIAAIGPRLAVPPQTESIDGHGGALLPGLHDHHVHLLATAAAARSLDVSALARDAFVRALRRADASLPQGRWLRVIGYHESAHGELDRAALDAVVPDRPLRIQHATGAMWVLNSAGADAVDLDRAPGDGIERDARGIVTGRLLDRDDWLFARLPRDPPDLSTVGEQFRVLGVTGVTDATPYRDRAALEHLRTAVATGALSQRVVVTGAPELDRDDLAPLTAGPAKVIVADHRPPDVDQLASWIDAAHRRDVPIALHCASRVALVLAVAALEQVGARRGDRIEHGAVVPPELFGRLRALGVTIVTQPAFVHARGDRYLTDVEPEDVAHLWRCHSLLAAGIRVAFGSDAPHGPVDPWLAVRAAVERRTRAGRTLGIGERLEPRAALERFLSPWHDPGGPPRRVEPGAPADLCLLHAPLGDVLRAPSADAVRMTLVAGRRVGE